MLGIPKSDLGGVITLRRQARGPLCRTGSTAPKSFIREILAFQAHFSMVIELRRAPAELQVDLGVFFDRKLSNTIGNNFSNCKSAGN